MMIACPDNMMFVSPVRSLTKIEYWKVPGLRSLVEADEMETLTTPLTASKIVVLIAYLVVDPKYFVMNIELVNPVRSSGSPSEPRTVISLSNVEF